MPRDDTSTFGAVLRRHRLAAGLTQEELAERALISARAISDLERGVNRSARRDTVRRLAGALDLRPEEQRAFEQAALDVESCHNRASGQQPTFDDAEIPRTFLIADVRGYTPFTLERGDEAAAKLSVRFAELAEEVVGSRSGRVVELRGDELLAVFSSARQALRAALEMQERFARETEVQRAFPLEVGIGLDTGEAVAVKGGYRGAALNLAARLCALAGAGEVLATEAVTHVARKVEAVTYVERGLAELKGFDDPVKVVQVVSDTRPLALEDSARLRSGGVLARSGDSPLPLGRFLGALPAGALVAREDELRRVLNAVKSVTSGDGRLIVLAGEPGVGKTRLAQEVMLSLRNDGFLVATGRCYEPEQSVPYYPFLDALSGAYRAAPSAVRVEASRQWPYLGRLLPDGLNVWARVETGEHDEQQLLFRAVTGFLEAIAEDVPVAVMLDDLHWADEATLRLVSHLARSIRTSRIVLLGTYRDVDVRREHPLQRALLDLSREGLVDQVTLGRLGAAGTAALVAETMGQVEMSAEFAELVHAWTEGNPFFVQQVLRVLVERGDMYRRDGQWIRREVESIEVPEGVRVAIGLRLSRLTERTLDILREASVLGQVFLFDDLQRIQDRPEDEVEAALEEARARGLVREVGGDRFNFDHVLTQQALYTELSSRRKRRLHGAAARVLERLPEGERNRRAGELAWHFSRADEPERTLHWSLVAGERAEAVFAHGEAERHYRMALEQALQLGNRRGEGEARQKLGGVLTIAGRYGEALENLEAAARVYRLERDREAEAQVVAQFGLVHDLQGAPRVGLTRVQASIEEFGTGGASPGLFHLHLVSAELLRHVGRYDEALGAGETARDLSDALGDADMRAQADGVCYAILRALGRTEDDLSAVEERVRIAEQRGDLHALANTLYHAGRVHGERGKLTRAREYLERCLVASRSTGNPAHVSAALIRLGFTVFLIGEWSRARHCLEEAEQIERSSGGSLFSPYPLEMLGLLHACTGEWKAAASLLNEAWVAAERAGNLVALRFIALHLAALDLMQERPEAAIARLTPLLDRPGLEEFHATPLLPVLADAYLEIGDLDRADTTVSDAVRRAAAQHNRLDVVAGLRIQGRVRARQGRWDEAEQSFEETLSAVRAMPFPHAEGQTLFDYGSMCAAKGEVEQAGRHFEAAQAIFHRLGAGPNLEMTGRAIAGLRPT